MSSTYVNNLRLNEMGTGDASGTWGTTTNTNLELIGEALGYGTEAITTNADTHTTTVADGSSDAGRAMYLKYTGTLDSACTITIGPNTMKRVQIIENATSGSQNIIISQGSGANVTIAAGKTAVVMLDGAGSGAAVVDALTDLQVTDTLSVNGTTLTIGDATAEDTKLVLDGNAQDFYIGLDDSADDLVIGLGSTVGTTPAIEIDENQDIKFAQSIGVGQAASSTTGDIVAQTMALKGTTPTLTIGDAGAEDTKIVFDGNAKDFYVGLDDSADKLLIGEGSTVGTNPILAITDDSVVLGDGAAADLSLLLDGNAVDFHIGLDDSADDLVIGTGSTLGSNTAVSIDASSNTTFADGSIDVDIASHDGSNGLKLGGTLVTSSAAELNLLDALDRGSILYGNSSGATAVLGQGSADQVLTSDGTDISWADASSGGATSINGLSDAKTFGTSSLMLGDATTGTIDAANYNVGLGVDVFAALTTGDSNIAIGFSSANDLTTGSNNVSIGAYALDVATTESGQTAVGYQALTANDTNGGNTAVGYQAGSGITSGASNICIGYQAYDKGTTGYDTIAIGNNCLDNGSAYTGYYNTFVGNGAARLITSAINNTALGKSALAAETTGSTNTAVGYAALTAQDTGFSNTAVGSSAGTAVTTGDENCFLGDSAGLQNTSGSRNVAIGYRGFRGNSSGSDCIIIGSDASYTNCTGSKNIAIGNNAGYNWTTAYNNTVIGYNARTDEYNSYGAVTIGYNGVGYASEHVTFVNGSNKTYVSIGSTSWGGTSDQRLKENVQTSTAGLSFINDLRPVTFDWKKKKDIDNSLEGYEEDSNDRYIKNNPTNRHGFVAQEVKTALDNHSEVLSGNEIWSEAKDGTQGISEVALIPMLVKALQEADDKIDALTTRIETLEG